MAGAGSGGDAGEGPAGKALEADVQLSTESPVSTLPAEARPAPRFRAVHNGARAPEARAPERRAHARARRPRSCPPRRCRPPKPNPQVLLTVFDRLFLRDRLRAMSVCRHWLDVLRRPEAWRVLRLDDGLYFSPGVLSGLSRSILRPPARQPQPRPETLAALLAEGPPDGCAPAPLRLPLLPSVPRPAPRLQTPADGAPVADEAAVEPASGRGLLLQELDLGPACTAMLYEASASALLPAVRACSRLRSLSAGRVEASCLARLRAAAPPSLRVLRCDLWATVCNAAGVAQLQDVTAALLDPRVRVRTLKARCC